MGLREALCGWFRAVVAGLKSTCYSSRQRYMTATRHLSILRERRVLCGGEREDT